MRELMGIWKHIYTYFLLYVNVISIEKREALNPLQEELANVQDHLNLTKQVSLTRNLLVVS